MYGKAYSIEKLNKLRVKPRFWCKVALSIFIFDIVWFLWLRPIIFPSPISFNLLVFHGALIAAPLLSLVSAIMIVWQRIFYSENKPESFGDKLAIVFFILFCSVTVWFGIKHLYKAVLTGSISAKHFVFEWSNSPMPYIFYLTLTLIAIAMGVIGIGVGFYIFRHGPPNMLLKRALRA